MHKLVAAVVVAGLVVVGAGLYFWPALSGWIDGEAPSEAAAPTTVATAPQPVQTAPAPPEPAASQIEPLPPQAQPDAAPLPPLDQADGLVTQTLNDLMGRAAVLALLQTDGFVQRMVATVDNLPRKSAPARVWPVNPAPGRFMLSGDVTEAPQRVHPDNSARYDALVRATVAVSPAQAASVYRQLYPLFQQAWRDLGNPRGEFHTRVLQVLDHLLTTPVPEAPLRMTLTEVKGPLASQTPWLRYELADPALQGLSAGQRALLRTGPTHQRQLMTWLASLREALRP